MSRSITVGLWLVVSIASGCKSTPEETASDTGSSGSTGAGASTGSTPDPVTTSGSSPTTTTAGSVTAGETQSTAPMTSTEAQTDTGGGTQTTAAVDETSAGPGTDGSTSSGGTTGGGGMCVELQCDGKVYACGDCVDNDGDGKYDTADPECVSPCDDKEDTFATGLPGDNMDPCKQDCFFDGNSGGGQGDCAWNLKCDPLSPGGDECPYDPNFNSCPDTQPDECIMNCQVPNGCDCFGCCSVVVDGTAYDIFLGDPDCALDDIESCEMCSPNDDCDDECHPENCEVCFGQELPPECEDPTCDEGMPCEVDDMGGSNCPVDMFCNTGCCALITPQ